MKKTIAILLVMTIALAGVFAAITTVAEANASFLVTTSVIAVNRMQVTAAGFSEAHSETTLTAWDDYVTSHKLDSVAAPESVDTIGYLNVATNKIAGVAVKVSATPMVSPDTATDGYEIGYYITCNGSSAIHSGYDNTANTGLAAVTATEATTVVATTDTQASGALKLTTFEIKAELDNTSFENAPTATNYAGTVTFEFVS
jgi:uncharacterized protein YxeA